MTLAANKTTVGVAAPEAYVKIGSMQFNDATACRFQVHTFFNKAARDAENTNPLKMEEIFMSSFDHMAVEAPKAQLYAHMKTLPAFSDATDVL
jgi:hypothetical protein